MALYDTLKEDLRFHPRTWLVTGVAGFIGSNLLEQLLRLDQRVVGLDSFATGYRRNLDEVQSLVTAEQWTRFHFIEGDICRLAACRQACAGVDYVLHQAALGSVPRSIEDPIRTHTANVDGFVNMLVAAREAKVQRFVYASSSSVYGNHPQLPKSEAILGRPLSPYAATKLMNEIYAETFQRCYGFSALGLRYFNVFGPRQDPDGQYSAVIPRWFKAIIRGQEPVIYGDGSISRDFCYIANVIQANLLAATCPCSTELQLVYNIAAGARTTLIELFSLIQAEVSAGVKQPGQSLQPLMRPERAGDVRHSFADISLAKRDLSYIPSHDVGLGLRETAHWFTRHSNTA